MYTTRRYFFKYGNEGDEIEITIKEHQTFEKALRYAERYSVGIRFAGVQIEDEKGKLLYEITSNQEVIDYRKKF